jgi:hypothetical protein
VLICFSESRFGLCAIIVKEFESINDGAVVLAFKSKRLQPVEVN